MRIIGRSPSMTVATVVIGVSVAALAGGEPPARIVLGNASASVTGSGSVQTTVSITAAGTAQEVTRGGRVVCGTLSQGKDAAARIGHFGCLVIRTPARWQARSKQFAELGWTPSSKDLDTIDFTKQRLIVPFCAAAPETNFRSVMSMGDAAKPAQSELAIVCPVASTVTDAGMSLFLSVLSAAEGVKVSMYMIGAASEDLFAEKNLAWSAQFESSTADVVDGLRGQVRTKAATVKAGEDIEVEFTLQLADFAVDKTGWLAPPGGVIRVWDGKYSNGYRNHAFEVTTPDGAVHLLRPPMREWDKNAPHPVAIKADAPYVLPEWGEGVTFKSLKALGLDTTKPGKYLITGLYEERGGTQKDVTSGQDLTLWGGSLASNTVTVEVVTR